MHFSENSRVWIYQANKKLSDHQVSQIQQDLDQFTINWTAHNHLLKAKGFVKFNLFIILIVDESNAGASGCSIDKSVNFIKQMENTYQINLLDRFNFAYRDGEEVLTAPKDQFEELLKVGKVNSNTPVFNNLVQTLKELETNWEIPFSESWHARFFQN
jgi:hypothetical protein